MSRRLDYFFNIWPFTTRKICLKIAKDASDFAKPSKIDVDLKN